MDANTACFDTYQYNYEGFTSRSNVTACIEKYDDLFDRHNELVSDYSDLTECAQSAQAEAKHAERCVRARFETG